jgi:ornithine decarboxylase
MTNPTILQFPSAIRQEEERYRQLTRQYGSPLLLLDAEKLKAQYHRLQHALPNVKLYYAMKALPERAVVEVLVGEGAGLDVASVGELRQVRGLGLGRRNTIYTHPIKRDDDIREALRFGCSTFVVDNYAELDKFTRYKSRVGLLLRLRFQSADATVDLSSKFGLSINDAPEFLRKAKQRGIHIKGISFHVGSQSRSSQKMVEAVEESLALMIAMRKQGIAHMTTLDIGGGFPVDYLDSAQAIDAFCQPVRAALLTASSWVKVIAEPGRYLVAPAAEAVATVVGKAERDGKRWYYLDDGVYGLYSGQMYDHAIYPIKTFGEGEEYPSVLTGPTCDSIDVIRDNLMLPELDIGAIVVGQQMGAYTLASAGTFNSLPKPQLVVMNREITEHVVNL